MSRVLNEVSERVSQRDIRQKKVRAKGTASFCLGTGTSLLVQEQGGGKCDKSRVSEGRRWAKVKSYKVL